MSDLVVIAFPSEAKAEEVRQKLLDMQKDYHLARRHRRRRQTTERQRQAQPTVPSNGHWCRLRHASGHAWRALTDVGINDQFMKDVAQSPQSGNAALFLLIRKMTADKVLADLQGVGARYCAHPSTAPRKKPGGRRWRAPPSRRSPLPASPRRNATNAVRPGRRFRAETEFFTPNKNLSSRRGDTLRLGLVKLARRCSRSRIRHAADDLAHVPQRVLRARIWRRLRCGLHGPVAAPREPSHAGLARRRAGGVEPARHGLSRAFDQTGLSK